MRWRSGNINRPHIRRCRQFLAHFEAGTATNTSCRRTNLPPWPPRIIDFPGSTFGDGNGRITRLYSHAWIVRAGIVVSALWTLSRGLARQRASYFAALAAATRPAGTTSMVAAESSDRAPAQFGVFVLRRCSIKSNS